MPATPMVGTALFAGGAADTVVLRLYVNGPPPAGNVGVQTNVPRNVPGVEPVYTTVTVPAVPTTQFSGLGVAE